MASYHGSDFNDLAKLLFRSLTAVNPNFDPVAYLDEFESLETNTDKVNFVHKDIRKYPNSFSKFMQDTKDDSIALTHAENGKVKLNQGNYWEALEENTRCIATAKSNTVLALGYGNRSECFLNLKMPEKCLEEIERALKNSYPKDLVNTLIEKQKEAEGMEVSQKQYYQPINLEDNFEKNSKIQCANNCVKINSNQKYGRHVIATRDIDIGEIISIENPFTTSLINDRYCHCHHCLKLCYNLLPCSNCTVALFCSDECRLKARIYHKYECPILLTVCYRLLCEFAADDSMLLALKITLLVKDFYDQLDSLSVNDCEIYSSDQFSNVYSLEIEAAFPRIDIFHQAILTSIIFELLWNHTGFFSGIFGDGSTEDKFKHLMLSQLQSNLTNSSKIYEYVQKFDFTGTNNFGLGIYPFFSLFTHSCCANVMKTYHGSTMVLRALNTIKQGEQCFVNRYGLRYDASPKAARELFFLTHKIPNCECRACQENWEPNLGDAEGICDLLEIEKMRLGDVVRNVIGSDVEKAEQLLGKLIRLLKLCENGEPEGNSLTLKNLIVHCYVILGNKKIEFDPQRDIVLTP